MKIDRGKIKKGTSEVPAECKTLIERIKSSGSNCDQLSELLKEMVTEKSWNYGKCELYHWADVLDLFDEILSAACSHPQADSSWALACDETGAETQKALVLLVLNFTALLIEHSFTRQLYSSMEHLATLMTSSDMTVVLAVLNLLYVFSKRSNFITKLSADRKQALVVRLTHLAEGWGGKENGFGLSECCQDLPITAFPPSATTLHFEFYTEQKDDKSNKKGGAGGHVVSSIHLEHVDRYPHLASHIMEELLAKHNVPTDKQIMLFTHIRLAKSFSNYQQRIQCVQARLQAISILVYSSSITDNVHSVLYNGFIEELVDILEIKGHELVDIKAAALKTLTSVVHLDRNPKLQNIIEATGAASYHGFLPVLVRTCIEHMTNPSIEAFPQPFSTSLFSFLYHLASYESGGEALVSCGMMESLLRVVSWLGEGQEHITFVTRAVRVVDLVTNLDMQAFQTHGGLAIFINRLEHEVGICRAEQPYVIDISEHQRRLRAEAAARDAPTTSPASPSAEGAGSEGSNLVKQESAQPGTSAGEDMETDAHAHMEYDEGAGSSSETHHPVSRELVRLPNGKYPTCFTQRSALLKSMLNFLKKAIPEPSFTDSIRHLMDGSLPASLKHIISNAEYYGPSLFLLATEVVTVYVFQEPSLLSPLQDNGLTDTVLHALLVKDVPATREALASLPNVFSSLCLNTRGLNSFVNCRPFERLFKVLLSPDYLPAMRRRRGSDHLGDTASNLGSAMDELMRHQPSLKTEATKAIIKLLEEVCTMGTDPLYVCQRPTQKTADAASLTAQAGVVAGRNTQTGALTRSSGVNATEGGGGGGGGGGGSSDEEDEEELAAPEAPKPSDEQAEGSGTTAQGSSGTSVSATERKVIPLTEYLLNVMKFVEAILSNNTTDDHCREFISQGGLAPLMAVLAMPNLPVEFPFSASCQAVAAVCKSILTLAHEPQVLEQGLLSLSRVLGSLDGFNRFLPAPGGSVLLHELAAATAAASSGGAAPVPTSPATDPLLNASATPLLHAVTAAHAHVAMLNHVCKVSQADIRTMLVNHWGSELGLQVMRSLSRLYTALMWENSLLIELVSDQLPATNSCGESDLRILLPLSEDGQSADSSARAHEEGGSNGVRVALESLTTHDSPGGGRPQPAQPPVPMETHETTTNTEPVPSNSPEAGTTSVSECSTSGIASKEDGKSKRRKFAPEMQARLNSLLHATTRLLKSLSELFNLLVKLSVGSPVRQRRAQIFANPSTPTAEARQVAVAVSRLLTSGLTWQPPDWTPVPKLRLSFYTSCTSFTTPLLFDDKKMPYYLMLQKFLSTGGMDAMYETFRWALTAGGKQPLDKGLELPELPEGTGEFLDRWLLLLEKMVNVKNVLESPHTLQAKPGTGVAPFSPAQFLVSSHKMAFEAVMLLWGKAPLKTFGRLIAESTLAILSEIIKGQSIIKEQLDKETQAPHSRPTSPTPATTAAAPGAPPPPQRPIEPQVNHAHLQSLMDMGFSREHCIQALSRTNGLEQATEYILTHLPSAPSQQPPAQGDTSTVPPPTASQQGSAVPSTEADGGAAANNADSATTSGSVAGTSNSATGASGSALGTSGFTTGTSGSAVDTSGSAAHTSGSVSGTSGSAPNTSGSSTAARLASGRFNPEAELFVPSWERARPATVATAGGEDSDMDMSDEEQVRRAIEMSLGQSFLLAPDWAGPVESKEKEKEADAMPSAEQDVQKKDEPLSKEALDSFTQNMFTGCMQLLDAIPEAVYRICDLLVVVTSRNGNAWRDDVIQTLLTEISDLCAALTAAAAPLTTADQRSAVEWASALSTTPEAVRLATRLHLLTLLFGEMKQAVAERVQSSGVVSALVSLLDSGAQCLATPAVAATAPTPKWMAPLLLILDVHHKVALATARLAQIEQVVGSQHVWKCFDDRTGCWNAYSSSNNKLIDDAFVAGQPSVRFTANRRRYCVNFHTMVQVNEESENRRAVMLALPAKDDSTSKDQKSDSVGKTDQQKATEDTKMDTEEPPKKEEVVISGLQPEQMILIIRSSVALLGKPADSDTLHACLRLTLRLTRDHTFACEFVSLGGTRLLLGLTQASAFQGFLTLATHIFRHVVEEPATLRQTLEKVVRSSVSGQGSGPSGVASGSIGSKELNYVLRVLGPAACRDPHLFTQVAQSCLRIALPPPAKKDEQESRLSEPGGVQVLRCVGGRHQGAQQQQQAVESQQVKDTLKDLLNVLCQDHSPPAVSTQPQATEKSSSTAELSSSQESAMDASDQETSDAAPTPAARPSAPPRQGSAASEESPTTSTATTAIPGTSAAEEPQTTNMAAVPEGSEGGVKTTDCEALSLQHQRLMPKSAVLRLLAELVRSYSGCAMVIAQHAYLAGQSPLVTEDCSALSFVLDHLLLPSPPTPSTATTPATCPGPGGDKDCPALAKMLLAALAASTHSPEAQTALVSEIKAALQRALAQAESGAKHARLQALAGLISTVIDSPGNQQSSICKHAPTSPGMNSIVRLLLRKGLVNDLARIPQSLDLSSPHMAATMNEALRPLETLSRIVNQPQSGGSTTGGKSGDARGGGGRAAGPTGSGGSTGMRSDGSRAVVEPSLEDQMQPGENDMLEPDPLPSDVHIEDISHDAEQDHTDLEETHHEQVEEPTLDLQQDNAESELEQVLDELLQRNRSDNTEDEVIGDFLVEEVGGGGRHRHGSTDERDIVVDIEAHLGEEGEEDEEDQHDSQMVTQDISDEDEDEEEDETTQGGQDAIETSGEDEGEGEGYDDEDDEDDEDTEDEDDVEDDEEGSDMEGDDEYLEVGGGQTGADQWADDMYMQLLSPDIFGADSGAVGRDAGFRSGLLAALQDTNNANTTGASLALPPAPSNMLTAHPLLVRQPDAHSIGSSGLGMRNAGGGGGLVRGMAIRHPQTAFRYFPNSNTTVHYIDNSGRATRLNHTSNFLQNLLGPSFAGMMQFYTREGGQGGLGNAGRFHLIAHDELHHAQDLASSDAVLSNVPSALTRWTEECKVLDGETVHDVVLVLKLEITAALENERDAELAERREKRRKQAEEEEMKKKKEQQQKQENKDDSSSSADRTLEEEDKTIEWGTPPETRPAALQSEESSFTTLRSNPAGVQENSQAESNVSELDSQASVAELDRATVYSGVDLSFSNLTAVAAVSETPAVGEHAGVSSSVITMQTPPYVTGVAPTPAAPQRALGAPRLADPTLGFPNSTPVSASEGSALPPPPPPPRVTLTHTPATAATTMAMSSDSHRDPQRSGAAATSFRPLFDEAALMQAVVSSEAQAINELLSGRITPEQPSDITSSDNVTINSSPISTEPPSGGDIESVVTGSEAVTFSTTSAFGSAGQTGSAAMMDSSTSSSSSAASSTLASVAGVALTTAAASVLAGTSSATAESPNPFGDMPEGVDPSFLAALPESIRQEVIAEQLRLQRIQQRAQEQQQQAQQLGVSEVNPEFLAALPPTIQEEVLAQQRAEQARLAAQSSAAQPGSSTQPPVPEAPVDPAAFILSLPSDLRRQVLSDMDDSMVALLPADMAAEANLLRRDLEDRHRRLMQQRLFQQGSQGSLSALLRQSAGIAGRLGTSRFSSDPFRRPPGVGSSALEHWMHPRIGASGSRALLGTTSGGLGALRMRGRHLLDSEALACLLVLLFVDEPRLQTTRLHRVLRNLCYHVPTRAWVINALLAILHRTAECKPAGGQHSAGEASGAQRPLANTATATEVTLGEARISDSMKRKGHRDTQAMLTSTPTRASGAEVRVSQPTWLSISMDAALGCRANVFQIQHRAPSGGGSGKRHAALTNAHVSIHPQAGVVVCRHVLDALIGLGKCFPDQFLPPKTKAQETASCLDNSATNRTLSDENNTLNRTTDSTPVAKASSASNTSFAAQKGSKAAESSTPASTTPATKSEPASSSAKPAMSDDFWDVLLKLDQQTGGRKGKHPARHLGAGGGGGPGSAGAGGVAGRSGGESVEESGVASFSTAPLGQLMAMLAHPVVRRSQLLTDRLLRLLSLVSSGLEDVARSVSTCTPTTRTTTGGAPNSSVVTSTSMISSVLGPLFRPATASAVTQPPATAQPASTLHEDTLNETMDFTTQAIDNRTSTPLPGKAAEKPGSKAGLDVTDGKKEPVMDSAILEQQLHLAVQVLTSKSCSEEGLEDATNLLLWVSRANAATRGAVLQLLLSGARQLGLAVCTHIRQLMNELRQLSPAEVATREEEDDSSATAQRGVIRDRFDQSTLVVNSPTQPKPRGGRDLQLPSMNLLTSKSSNQHFLLRMLKVIIQLRDASKAAAKEKTDQQALEAAAMGVVEFVISSQERRAFQPRPGGSGTEATAGSSGAPTSGQPSSTAGGSEAGVTGGEAGTGGEAPMDVDQEAGATATAQKPKERELPSLSGELALEELWETLGECLTLLARTRDHHAVLVLQPAVEAFFLVHAGEKDPEKKKESQSQRREDQLEHLNIDYNAPMSPAPPSSSSHEMHGSSSVTSGISRQDSAMSASIISPNMPPDTQKFLRFAEKHRVVLNHILRQSTSHLADGPFSVLVEHTRMLDFDVKRRYFRQELERLNDARGMRRDDLPVHVGREHVFEDSFRELLRKTADDWKRRFYIVFEGEEGQDAGGLLREWYLIMSREIFNPNYALFMTSPGDRVTYTINPLSYCNSNHLSYYKFVGRFLAKAIYDNKLLECYFTRSFYKHILGKAVRYTDMESEDYAFYQGLVFLLEHNVVDLGYDLTFSTDIQEFGVSQVRELKEGGQHLPVTEENKKEYVKLVCQEKMTGAIRKQLNSFLEGFYDIIPKRLISIFNEQEIELLMSGLPTFDIEDLKANTEYHKYQTTSLQIQWFWRALRSFDQNSRAAFLQFVTGTSKVPLQGFSQLEGMNGVQKFQIHRDDRSTDRLPCAHTCFNQLDLPAYETYDKLRHMLLLAIHECSEGFGLA